MSPPLLRRFSVPICDNTNTIDPCRAIFLSVATKLKFSYGTVRASFVVWLMTFSLTFSKLMIGQFGCGDMGLRLLVQNLLRSKSFSAVFEAELALVEIIELLKMQIHEQKLLGFHLRHDFLLKSHTSNRIIPTNY